tara:strand:+ start:30 stop:173 length:144 start_codon:yes stop_codon:yes gene_type:complete
METKQIITHESKEDIEEDVRDIKRIIRDIHSNPKTMRQIREFIEETS